MLGSEAMPFAKTGGLADVLGALPAAIARHGWPVTLAIPRYRGVAAGTLVDRFPVTVGAYTRDIAFYEAPLADGARVLLIDCPDLFEREALYALDGADYPDNPRRFAMLVRAALEYASRHAARPAVVHAHDWQTGLAPVYLKTRYARDPVLAGTPSVFTIHNLAYQGLFEADWLPRLDLAWDQFAIDRLEYWGRVSFLKGGINDADLITTVSPTYAEEIQTAEDGSGFDGILRSRAPDLVGILNGIDTAQWNPRHDSWIPEPFDDHDFSGKAAAKQKVLARYRLATDDAAMKRGLIGMISRMVDQKGLDLIEAAAEELFRLDATWVVLGTGDRRYEDLWKALAGRHPDRVGVRVGFDEPLAHLIEAGADMFLMPSRFEPCGLNQMYSLRYGTVPIVRAVGGLSDTVRDYRPRSRTSTGFAFHEYTGRALLEAVQRALALFEKPDKWRVLQQAGMRQDHSWDRSAREYVTIYERAIRRRRSGSGIPTGG